MEQLIYQLRSFWTKVTVRKIYKTVGTAGCLMLVGWISGTLIAGVLNQPSDLNAAISTGGSISSPVVVDGHQNPGFSAVVKVVRPAVVHITVVEKRSDDMNFNPFGSPEDFSHSPFSPDKFKRPPGMGMGSGVIVSPDGHVVTNHHVVDGADHVKVRLFDKREFKGTVVGSDPQTDVAVIKIDGSNLPFLKWGDSSKLQVGDYVLAVGNPFGLTATVTQGIVSAVGRGGMGITQYEDFIQTDAAINPGNSGGALVNATGELIGINTAILSRTGGYQGVGFAVPSDMAQPIYTSLKDDGKVIRGFLGVGIQEVTPDLAASFELDKAAGALVTNVRPGSPADKAGIQRGDVIVKYQGKIVEDPRGLQREVIQTPVGTSVSILVIRESHEQELRTSIAEKPSNKEIAKAHQDSEKQGLAGIKVEPVNSHTAQKYGIDRDTEGVVVTAVALGSPAEQAGLARGDVIREVNHQPISSLQDYYQAANSLEKEEMALLFINRLGTPLFLTVKV